MLSLTQGKRGRRPDPHAGNSARRTAREGGPCWKRLLDLGVVTLTAPLWVPLTLGIGAAIKLQSPGAVLLRQERVGLRGRRFGCLQFRIPRAGNDAIAPGQPGSEPFSSRNPLSPVNGRGSLQILLAGMLRGTGLAHLPQLFNVLRAEMSLVGPRPGTPREYNSYSRSQRARTETLPGMTGLWQVTARDRTTYQEMLGLDLQYVRSRCLARDLGILFRTPTAWLPRIARHFKTRPSGGSTAGEASPQPVPRPGRPAPAARVPQMSRQPGRRLLPCDTMLIRSQSLQPAPGGSCSLRGECEREFCQQPWH